MSTTKKFTAAALAAGLGLVTLSACGSSGSGGGDADSKTVTLVSHDSWAASKSVLEDFEKQSGYTVKVLKDGDAGQAVNKAILTKDNPQGDVFFGVDNTLLSRALDNGLFQPYEAKGSGLIRPEYQVDRAKHRVTPIDSGDICVNYDKKYFADHKLDPPASFGDLVEPRYKNLLVTENAATSSPGLGFLLGTAAEYGDKGWPDYWKKLKANGVKVVDGWEQAYNQEFSGSAGGKKAKGDRPLVVSYASSPPAEVIYASPKPKTAPTGVASGTCFRQVEYAGLLSNAKNTKGGKALLDFLVTKEFQEDMPLNMFVYPVVKGAQVPAEFSEFGPAAKSPETLAPAEIADNRDQWVKSWTSLVLK
ncbi:ABC transporter substrate-binding protein [Streptomyces avermitilis]|uniref:ABC transporter substrate-binding protein n=2 Tax=Streptomyces avermitilis TaxID=33903 RepID=Q82JY4_STRAW|nr:thiamine ABC transporter substrate-binding protein [Streptomyces avermitilis]MYS98221.1 thiamine ABC transporter substrate-binding protein [Streptomyces sp. SID5469]KUN51477.1 ABC transporter substrate-binding protein [Streptomyces avermitilis]OOV33728.1 thiamine ABC transporter substrate-binding protein [Streptomyces avermitilis]BAC70331.1 putative ABC transporter substrate-binding protein [Streptomyces avermitilis MA-4680 = NBRC 14893]BBJ50425.1 thiamine ABC transporter substrate-binding 